MSEGWALICEIGLWGWVASAAGLILKAFPSRDELNVRKAVFWGGSLITFYALWMIGMVNG